MQGSACTLFHGTLAAPQQTQTSLVCVRLAHCFTGTKEQNFKGKTSKKSVKIGELFKTNLNC